MPFIPAFGRIEIEPIRSNTFLVSEDKSYIEKGKIVAINEVDTKPEYGVGDIIYFEAYGIYKTPEENGVSHYVLRNKTYIIGKDGE